MPIERSSYISQLDPNNPNGKTDKVSSLDNHVRMIKSAAVSTFPNFNEAVDMSAGDLNELHQNLKRTSSDTWDVNNSSIVNVKATDEDSAVQPRQANDGRYLQKENNLSDVQDPNQAIMNLFSSQTGVLPRSLLIAIGEYMMPVGYIVHLYVNTHPRDLFGFGVWDETFAADRTLTGVGSRQLGNPFGSSTTTLTIDQIPPHNHAVYMIQAASGRGRGYMNTLDPTVTSPSLATIEDRGDSPYIKTRNTGNGQPFNILGPSRAVRIWRRTE